MAELAPPRGLPWRTSATSSPTRVASLAAEQPARHPGDGRRLRRRRRTGRLCPLPRPQQGRLRLLAAAVRLQSLPVITAVIPLFILFAKLGLVDNLLGLTIIYVGVHDVRRDLDDGRLLRLHPDHASRKRPGSTALGLRRLHPGRAAQLPARRALHRDLHLPARVERLPRGHRVPALRPNLHPAPRRAVLLPAEPHRLGLGHGRRRRDDGPASHHLRHCSTGTSASAVSAAPSPDADTRHKTRST